MAGDDHAGFRHHQRDFDALFRAHYAEIVRYLAVRLGSRDDAADVAAEVFVAAWRGVPAASLPWPPGARVALPGRGEHGQRPAEGTDARAAPDRRRDRAAGRGRLGRVADRDVLGRALRRLPADQQLAVHLRLVEGYSFAEVGRVMGRSAGACQMLVLRAGRQLREALEREGVHASG